MALTFKGLTFKKDAPIIVDPSRPLVQQAPPQQASIDFSKIQVIPQGAPQEQQAGFIRQLPGMAAKAVMAAPPAIASAAEQFMQSERERQAQQTLPQQAYYELVERPLKILGFFAGGMSEAGKTMMEFAATGALAPFRGVGEASLIAQEAVRGDAQQQ